MGPCFRMCQIDLTGLVEVACKQTKDFDAAASCFWLPLGLIITAVTWPFDQECFFFGTNTSGSMMTRQYNTGHHIQPFNPRIVSCTFKLTLGTSWHILAHHGTLRSNRSPGSRLYLHSNRETWSDQLQSSSSSLPGGSSGTSFSLSSWLGLAPMRPSFAWQTMADEIGWEWEMHPTWAYSVRNAGSQQNLETTALETVTAVYCFYCW